MHVGTKDNTMFSDAPRPPPPHRDVRLSIVIVCEKSPGVRAWGWVGVGHHQVTQLLMSNSLSCPITCKCVCVQQNYCLPWGRANRLLPHTAVLLLMYHNAPLYCSSGWAVNHVQQHGIGGGGGYHGYRVRLYRFLLHATVSVVAASSVLSHGRAIPFETKYTEWADLLYVDVNFVGTHVKHLNVDIQIYFT